MRLNSFTTLILTGAMSLGVGLSASWAQTAPPSLKTVPVPEPANLAEFVKDKQAAIVLGKALFWDVQVGSDRQACASCHFHAGGDNRVKNQLSPGLLRVHDPERTPNPDITFGAETGLTASGELAGPNYALVEDDFPFHQLADSLDRNSEVLFDMNDVVSSQGTFDGGFVSASQRRNHNGMDDCENPAGDIFHVGGVPVRKVEPRNTPTMINAVFNHRNFWDGRASNIFNGVDPFGKRTNAADADAGVWVAQADGSLTKKQIEINNASLASQAVGPPLSDLEMSCAGRTFADLGRKMVRRQPLALQEIHPNDSVLGADRQPGAEATGLRGTYQNYIQRAFQNAYWASDELVDGYRQMELNFSLFFGLAVQLYEATLVSDDALYDQVQEGVAEFTDQQQLGLNVFLGKGKCILCHEGSEFTGASVRLRANQPDGNEEPIERMLMAVGTAVYDGGFYNIGVRPTFEDLGVGGVDPFGNPLSFSRQAVNGPMVDDFNFHPDRFEVPGPIALGERVAVDGAFKVPTIRNVELTGPYFHNGGTASLEQVVEFYDRGGDRRDVDDCTGNNGSNGDTSGFANECSNLDPDITLLGFTPEEEAGLVAFMKTLTDERVRWERAPFDHPQLLIPNGHPGDQFNVTDGGTGRARDDFLELPAVGAAGRAAEGLPPLGSFLSL